MEIIILCVACAICGILIIGTQLTLDKANAISLGAGEYGFYGVGMFLILFSCWGIGKEFKYRHLIKQKYL